MTSDTLVAVFADHGLAERAVKDLGESGFDMKQISVIGQGYHTEEKVLGFYNTGDRVKFWGKRGAFWGGLWGLLFGGVFMIVPVVGPVMVLGYLAAAVVSALEGAVVVGGLSALGAALFSIGIPKDSVLDYEAALKADEFLVAAHGTPEALGRARTVLANATPLRMEMHAAVAANPSAHT